MNIFLTGATGFVGCVLAKRLSAQGETIHVLVRDPSKASDLSDRNIKIFKGDISDPESIATAMTGCNRIFHCAGYTKLWARDKAIFYAVNVEGTRNILDEAYKQGIEKFVYTSSTAVWGPNPYKEMTENDPRIFAYDNDYDLSKHMAEELVKEYTQKGLFTVIVNPSRIYGPGKLSYSNGFSRLLKMAMNRKTVVLPRSTETIANYAFIDDVAEGHILAMKYGQSGERYILGGENISYKKLFRLVIDKIGKVKMILLPSPVMKLAGWLEILRSNIFSKEPAFTPGMLDRYYTNMAFTCSKAIKQLGYHITPFEQGLDKTIEFFKTHQHG